MKATEQYFLVVLFIMLYKLIPTFVSVDEVLKVSSTFDWSCLFLKLIVCQIKFGIFLVLQFWFDEPMGNLHLDKMQNMSYTYLLYLLIPSIKSYYYSDTHINAHGQIKSVII